MLTNSNNLNSGHRKRLRSKFLHGNGKALHDYEKLELLLTYSIPRRDVKPLAKQLLIRFGSIQNIMNATVEELTEIKGISENSAALILLVKELCTVYLEEKLIGKNIIRNLSDAVNFARMKIGGYHKETYMVILLDARNGIIHYECFTQGTINHTTIYTREIIELALKHHAASIILIHNHPTGIVMPSAEDLNATVKIIKALKPMDIELFDHIIVSASDFYSMAAKGDLPKIRI